MCGLGNLVLNKAFADSGGETALVLDGHEVLPSILGYGIGQILNIVAAGGGVDDLVQIRLLFQQQLLVACNAVAEVVGLFEGDVERSHADGVGTGDGSAHSLGGGAQHIDIRVKDRLVVSQRCGVDISLASAVARRLVLLHNLAPQHTCGAYFGNLHKVVAAGCEVEGDVLGHGGDIAALVAQLGKQLVGLGQREAKFLHDVGAGVGKQLAVHSQHAELRQVLLGIVQQLHGLGIVALFAFAESAVLQSVGKNVEVDGTLNLLGVKAVLLGHSHKELQGLQIVF